MAKLYKYPEAKKVVVCGDIHGDFRALVHKLCIGRGFKDTLLIVAGDCGFGFGSLAYYELEYRKVAPRLSKANNFVVFVRGNHDDPAYFREEKIPHKRWRTVPDYSVLSACGHNILCIGGAVSIDRSRRLDFQRDRGPHRLPCYWPDEMPVFDPEAIAALPVPVDTVVTHCSPSFCAMHDSIFVDEWSDMDPALREDMETESQTMDSIHQCLRESSYPVTDWFFGHYHQSWVMTIDGIRFKMLDILEFSMLLND